jgi:O-antigen ligase
MMSISRWSYVVGPALFALAWLLPGHFRPWASFQQETLAALAAAVLTLGALCSGVKHAFVLPAPALAAGALAAVPMVQWAAGRIPYFADALLPALYLCAFALTVVAARQLAETHGERSRSALISGLCLAALASAGIGLAQGLRLDPIAHIEMLEGGRVYGNLSQPNHLATLLALGFVGFWWGFETRRLGPFITALALAFVGLGIVMTQSRSSWMFAGLLLLWWLSMRQRLALRTRASAVAFGVFAFALATLVWPMMDAWIAQGAAASDLRTKAGTRPIHWQTLWDAAWREPWIGYGWHQVSVAQQAATLDHPAAHEWLTFSHNAVLDLMVWNGAIPGLLLSVCIAWWAVRRVSRCRSIDGWALLAAGGALLAHSMLEFPLAYLYFLLPFAAMVGTVDALEAVADTSRPRTVTSPRWLFASAAAVTLGTLLWVWVEYIQIEDAWRAMGFREAGVVRQGDGPELPDVRLLDNQREFLWFRSMRATPGLSAETLDRMKILSQRFAPPAAMLRYALAAGLNGREDEAERNLALICHMWPKRNCHEGRASWLILQKQYPQLTSIPFPSLAPHD